MQFINGETIGILLFFIGAWGLVSRKNVLKTILSIGIMQTAVILFFLYEKDVTTSVAPIGDLSTQTNIADPLPQALMITEIVIGAGITAAALVMFIHLFHKYGSTNWSTLRMTFQKQPLKKTKKKR